MALTADTKIQRMPSESAAQSLAVALPASQTRYCCVIFVNASVICGNFKAKQRSWDKCYFKYFEYSTIKYLNTFYMARHHLSIHCFFLGCHERHVDRSGNIGSCDD